MGLSFLLMGPKVNVWLFYELLKVSLWLLEIRQSLLLRLVIKMRCLIVVSCVVGISHLVLLLILSESDVAFIASLLASITAGRALPARVKFIRVHQWILIPLLKLIGLDVVVILRPWAIHGACARKCLVAGLVIVAHIF